MFKKLFVLLLSFTILSVQAEAASSQGLKAAFDELNYNLTVEWDQKDADFKVNEVEKFNASLYKLKAQGLTPAELISFVKSEVKDRRLAQDLETAFNMISIQKMSSTEANTYIVETMKRSYSSGASWSGKTYLYVGIGVAIVAIAIILASTLPESQCDQFKGNNTFVCDYYVHGGIPYDDCYWTDSHCI